MENSSKSDIEFSLVDVILPLAEMWKILVVLPVVVAGVAYVIFQFYPANLTYSGVVHLPAERVSTLISEQTITERLVAISATDSATPSASDLLAKLQIIPAKPDETRLSIDLPREYAASELLGAIMGLLEPEADRFLEVQKRQNADDLASSGKTLATLQVSADAVTTALSAERSQVSPDDDSINALNQTLSGISNALWNGQNYLMAGQVRFSELAASSATEPFKLVSKSTLYVALSFGGTLFLVLAFIYIRQEIRFALSHDHGRQKVARMMQHLKIFPTGKAPRP